MTTQRLAVSSGSDSSLRRYSVAFPSPAPLRASDGARSGLFLSILVGFDVVESERPEPRRRWQARTRWYEYRILDHHATELLVYHWQPGPGFAGPDHPHLHVSAALDAQVNARTRRLIGLDKVHIVTGRVSLAMVVRMLITEFDIAPHRHDWRETLDRSEALLAGDIGPRS